MSRIVRCPQILFLLIFVLFQAFPNFIQAAETSVPASETTIKGRVFTEAGPMPDAKVSAYSSFEDLQNGKPPSAVATTDSEGVYRMGLKPGSYYFVARGDFKGHRYFAYHGANPIKVGDDKFWLALLANPEKPVEYVDGATGIEGSILFKGRPVDGAYVAVYTPGKKYKGLGIKTESAGTDGHFNLGLLPDRYMVLAKKNFKGMSNRPLQKGDLWCYNSNNPVEVKDGKTTRIELSCFPVNDRSSFATAPFVKEDDLKTFAERRSSSGSGIRGQVTDPDGKPIANLAVQAYLLTAPVTQMYHFAHGTEFATITDESGMFFIPIDEDGDYGVIARNVLGDGPHRGEIFGFYQGNSRYAVAFKKGAIVENINILADKVMQPPKDSEVKKKAVIVGTHAGEPALLTDSVISSDTIWQGEILISGVISIKRGATLTIRPGTVVKFKRIDRDKNNVGDGEIMVEGRLIAKGTSDKKIVFTSAEEKPKISDWSYVQFISSDPDNVIENCEFQYAYAGVMIHYANVRISDTLFHNNRRGLHFTSTDMPVDHCTFVDNQVGIYFVRFEGKVRFTNNEISRNDVGVQFVKQHINLVDFENLDQGKEPPHFENNNIYNNRKYNFSLGEDQNRDINVAGNWWGTTDKDAIAETIFDRSNDKTLGRISFEPVLNAPVKGSGVQLSTSETKGKQQNQLASGSRQDKE
jgi:hypothetical protein